MRLVAFSHDGIPGIGRLDIRHVQGRLASDPLFPGDLDTLIGRGPVEWSKAMASLSGAELFPLEAVRFRTPFSRPNKILCVGLNYRDHTQESGYPQPDYPTFFTRFTTTLVPHLTPIVRPQASNALDFEGELANSCSPPRLTE